MDFKLKKMSECEAVRNQLQSHQADYELIGVSANNQHFKVHLQFSTVIDTGKKFSFGDPMLQINALKQIAY